VLASSQNKRVIARSDTLVSRVELIQKLQKDIEQVQKDADYQKLILYGQIKALEAQTADSIRITK
jgi:hypothetical protein